MNNLSHNIHEEYPQKIFEIGKVFSINKEIAEKWCLGVVMSSNNIGFTETRSLLRSIVKINFGEEICTKSYEDEFFITGRSANIYIKDSLIGVIGEVSPKVISEFNMRVPVSAFEIVLSDFLKL
jgi:phenylalanyl-tRNA synthetase beta chain